MSKSGKVLLVGDNPFHKISHLSQERTRVRSNAISNPEYAASLITMSLAHGADGFMFSVSETTLSILEAMREKEMIGDLSLYAIVPYAYEYVKLATQVGGISGLARNFTKRLALSRDLRTMLTGLIGLIKADPIALMKTYLLYEVHRIKSSGGKQASVNSLLLHEVITDLALSLNLDWLFKAYIDIMSRIGISPGFNTCNFAYLVRKFEEWHIDLCNMVIAAPFNRVGFQMNPSKEECEETLRDMKEPVLIAISILAAGYLKPLDAIDYVATLPNLRGVAVGVSKESHARETFGLLNQKLIG